MARKTSLVLGVLFILLGILGFSMPHMAGTHLSSTHNLIHLASGAAAVYFGIQRNASTARLFCCFFGLFYLLLGILGFAMGRPNTATEIIGSGMATPDRFLWTVIPGKLALGIRDHVLHIILAAVFLLVGWLGSSANKSNRKITGTGVPRNATI